MIDITPEIVISAITTVGAILVAFVSRKKEGKQKEKLQKTNIEHEALKRDFARFVMLWGFEIGRINKLIEETEIDRFLVLRAVNGVEKPKKVTAIYQIREPGQEIVDYIDIDIKKDKHYQNMLEEIRSKGSVYIVVSDMPDDAILKSFYKAEGVTSSFVVLLSVHVLNDKRASIHFATFATHRGFITKETQTKCIIARDRLAGTESRINESKK